MDNYSEKKYNTARNKGYITDIATSSPAEFKKTFIGVFVTKHPERTITLDILREVTGVSKPDWSDLNDRNLKSFRDAVLERMSSNSARTIFAQVKAILNDMQEEVDIPCIRFKDILKAKKEPTQSVYLSEAEVESLEAVETYDDNELYVKSAFLISCYTGCRHSDAVRLTIDNIDPASNTLKYVSIKTRIEACLPCHKGIKEHIQHLQNCIKSGVDMWDYEYNDILRKLCRRARIVSRAKVFRAGREETGEKYSLVASHTGRRSFVTNLYLRGVDLDTIARLAGHTDSQMTRRYLCATRELNSTAMSFFA